MAKRVYKCKWEELPVIAGFLVNSMEADLADFSALSPVFDAAYVTALREKRDAVLALARPQYKTGQLKKVSATLSQQEKALRPMLNRMEGYVRLASGELDVHAQDFGFKALRHNIDQGNDEGVLTQIKTVLQNANRNFVALHGKGMQQSDVDALVAAFETIDTLNNRQNSLMNERSALAVQNVEQGNALWAVLLEVMQTGKALYRGIDDERLKQYTFTALLKRVRSAAQTTKTEEE